jgi:hypothetical protein
VNGADPASLDVAEGLSGSRIDLVFSQTVSFNKGSNLSLSLFLILVGWSNIQPDSKVGLEAFPEAKLHLVCGLIGEGQRHDFSDLQRFRIAHQQMYQAIHEQGGLTRSRSCRDHHITIKGGRRQLAIRPITKIGSLCTFRTIRHVSFPFV